MPLSIAQGTASINVHMTEFISSLGPANFNMKNDEIAPPLEVPGAISFQFDHESDTFLEATETEWTEGQPANQVISDKPEAVEEFIDPHALQIFISDREIKKREQAGISKEIYVQSRIRKLWFNHQLQKEIKLGTKITTAANFVDTATIAGGSEWNGNNGDPTGDISTGRQAMNDAGYPATHATMDENVMITLATNAALLIFGSPLMRHKVGADEFKEIYDITPIVTNCRYKSSGSLVSPYGDDFVLMHRPDVAPTDMSGGTFLRTIYAQRPVVLSWRDDMLKGDWHRIEEEYAHQFAAINTTAAKKATAGYLIKNTLA